MKPPTQLPAGPGQMSALALDHLAMAVNVPARFHVDAPLEKYLRLIGVMPAKQTAASGDNFSAVLSRLMSSYGQSDVEGWCRATGHAVSTTRVWKSRGFVPNAVLLKACVQRSVQLQWLLNGAAE